MTTVKIYGFLAKEFGDTIKVHLGKINDALNAIDAIKNGFRKRINELNKNKFHYSIFFDKKNKILHILPIIGGNSRVFKWVIVAILVIAAIVSFIFGQYQLGAMFLNLAISTAMSNMDKPRSLGRSPDQFVGGAIYNAESVGKSYVFDNLQNQSSQGAIVNFGYGRYKTASRVLAISAKTYPTNISFIEEVELLTTADKINIYD